MDEVPAPWTSSLSDPPKASPPYQRCVPHPPTKPSPLAQTRSQIPHRRIGYNRQHSRSCEAPRVGGRRYSLFETPFFAPAEPFRKLSLQILAWYCFVSKQYTATSCRGSIFVNVNLSFQQKACTGSNAQVFTNSVLRRDAALDVWIRTASWYAKAALDNKKYCSWVEYPNPCTIAEGLYVVGANPHVSVRLIQNVDFTKTLRAYTQASCSLDTAPSSCGQSPRLYDFVWFDGGTRPSRLAL